MYDIFHTFAGIGDGGTVDEMFKGHASRKGTYLGDRISWVLFLSLLKINVTDYECIRLCVTRRRRPALPLPQFRLLPPTLFFNLET